MVKNRLIAVLIVRNGQVVQSIKFKHTNIIHSDPVEAIDMFNEWAVDEVVVLNVSRKSSTKDGFVSIVKRLAEKCFVPLSAGGWIETVEDAKALIRNGADKVVVNTEAFRRPGLIGEIVSIYGSQCCVLSIDSKMDREAGKRRVCIDRGSELTDVDPISWAQKAVDLGVGEVFFNSVDHDGNRAGYDLEMVKQLAESVTVPVVAFGGVQTWDHLVEGLEAGKADAIAAANILHYTEHSVVKAKKHLVEKNLNVRGI